MDELSRRLAATVQAWMRARRLNKLQLSLQAGIGRQTVHRLLNGENTDLNTVKRIAELFQINPVRLLAGELPAPSQHVAAIRPSELRYAMQGDLDALRAQFAELQSEFRQLRDALGVAAATQAEAAQEDRAREATQQAPASIKRRASTGRKA